jgi:hypothetical protein
MKMLPVSLSLMALVCAGCATQPSTSAMGAGRPNAASAEKRTVYCKDGAYVTKSVGCGGAGVERDMTSAPAASKY